MPINGGSSLRGKDSGIDNLLYDDQGDNISELNSVLCEMTSVYWAWKHLDKIGNPDYIGFNHYRKFFKKEDLVDFADWDAIAAKPVLGGNLTLAKQYDVYHVYDDLLKALNVIADVHGNETYSKVASWFATETDMTAPYNMFVLRRDKFVKWCEFIFPVLFEIMKRIDLTGRDGYQKRAICFLTERLLSYSVWQFRKGGAKVKEVAAIVLDEDRGNDTRAWNDKEWLAKNGVEISE